MSTWSKLFASKLFWPGYLPRLPSQLHTTFTIRSFAHLIQMQADLSTVAKYDPAISTILDPTQIKVRIAMLRYCEILWNYVKLWFICCI